MVALGDSSEAAIAASADSTSEGERPSNIRTASTSILPSVSVPVLSMHRTSTRASPSTAGSSRTRTRCRASRTTAAAKAMLMRSTSPSGTMATVPATAPETDARQLPWARYWLQNSSPAVGTTAHDTYFSTRLIPSRSSDVARANRRASS